MRKMKLYQDRDWLYQKYIIEKLSGIEIAEICKISSSIIYKNLKKCGIKIRSYSEATKGKKKSPLTEEHKTKLRIAKLGKKFSEAHKRKLSKALKKRWQNSEYKKRISKKVSKTLTGKKFPEKHRKNISISHKGQIPWNKGKKGIYSINKAEKNPMFGKHHSEKHKEKLSKLLRGKNKGEKNGQWQGGISFEPYGIEFNRELKERIRKRDNYICQMLDCNSIQNGRKFPIHHTDYNKRNNEDWNLITLCHSCHIKTNTNREYWENYFKAIRDNKTV